jgi:multimeric flavodoxin WrbA
MKNILVISSTLRKGGNSGILANEFAKGATQAGNNVDVITLVDKSIQFCKGCLDCQKTNQCVINDDMTSILPKVKNADVIVFATPVYYYGMSGQLKTVLDRLNPLFSDEYSFREVYLIGTAAEDEKSALDGTINSINGWVSCFENVSLRGVIYGIGATNCGDIKKNELVMKEAYEGGKLS